MYSTGSALLALNTDAGTGQQWDDAVNGRERSQASYSGVTQVYSTASALLALNTECGKVLPKCSLLAPAKHTRHAEDDAHYSGGGSSQVSYSGATQVYSTVSASLALNTEAANCCYV